MSNKFTRNITGTKLRGEIKEPFTTNVQNDLLSDETDVYVRQERSKKIDDNYHCLTDNVKEVISNSDLITTVNFDHEKDGQEEKNKSYINVNKATKQHSEQGTSNSSVMTPLQTKYAIDYNNENVIPSLVKEHETPTKIVSKSDDLKVTEVSKNNFEIEVSGDGEAGNPLYNLNIDRMEILVKEDFSGLYILLSNNKSGQLSLKDINIKLMQVIQHPTKSQFRTNSRIISNDLYKEELKGYDPYASDMSYRNFIEEEIRDTGSLVFNLNFRYGDYNRLFIINGIKEYVE